MKTDLLSILAKNYAPPYWAFMREFRNATAFDATRSADALAFGLYRSRGQVIIGFEVKTYRSDWLRELKNPDKADAIGQFCDYFHLVTPAADPVAEPGELPATWGLIHVDLAKCKTKQVKPPEKLDARPLTRPFFCAIVKQAMDSIAMPGLEALREARDAGYQEGIARAEGSMPGDVQQLRELEKQVRAFETASGIRIHSWEDGHELAAAVILAKKIMAGDQHTRRALEDVQAILSRAMIEIHSDITTMEKLQRQAPEQPIDHSLDFSQAGTA